MKKVMMMAMMLMASTMTFAGDSDGLKAIMKSKNYDEAAQLLTTNLASLADASEKAKAYNKLVDLAMEKVTKETGIIAENQLNQQMGTGKVLEYDAVGMGDAICNAISNAIECNKYDQAPDAKGKVKPKFDKKNAERIWAVRPHLVNLGQDEAQKHNNAVALKFWGAFLDSASDPLFAEQNHEAEKPYVGQVAYFTGRYAYDAKDMERANKYLDIAMQDPEQKKDALNFKLYAMRSQLHTKADSLQFVDQLKALYAQDPENDVILDGLFNMYDGMKDKAAQVALLDNHLAKYPNSFAALADKGMMAMADNNATEGANWMRKAAQASPENAAIQTYLGICLNALGSESEDNAKRKAYYEEAIQAFDKAKELDPNKAQANWGYNRYQAYYALYGEEDARTKAAEADSH